MVQTDSEEQRQKGNKDKVEKQEGQQEQMQNTCCRIKTNENRQKNIVCVIGMSLLRGFLFALCFLLSGCLDLTMLLVPMIPVFCKPNWSALWTWLGLQFTVVNLSRERFDLWAELIVDSAMKTNRNPWLVGCFIQGVVLHHFIEIAISHDFRVLRCQDGSWFRLMFFCCRPVQAGPALWILHGFATGHPCAWMVTPWSVGCVVSGIYGWIQEWYCWWTLYPITTSGYGKLSREWTRPVDEPKSVIPLSTKQSLDDLDLRIWHFFIPLPEPRKKIRGWLSCVSGMNPTWFSRDYCLSIKKGNPIMNQPVWLVGPVNLTWGGKVQIGSPRENCKDYLGWHGHSFPDKWDGMKIRSEMPWWPSNVRFCQD